MSTLTVPSYRAALLTNGDGAPMVTGPDGSAILTEKQWYLFWNDLTRQVNDLIQKGGQFSIDLNGMIAFGLHADRPDVVDVPSGALYFETDRSSLYQNQEVGWQYVAGTMYGTLSPDERPTDLNASGDAGFQFRTTDLPARSFIWSGTAWEETTPPANSVQLAVGTASSQAFTTSAAPVTGMAVTLTRDGVYSVRAVFDMQQSGTGDNGVPLMGMLGVNTVLLATLAIFQVATTIAQRACVSAEWRLTATAGDVLQGYIQKGSGTGGSVIFPTNSTLSATWISA